MDYHYEAQTFVIYSYSQLKILCTKGVDKIGQCPFSKEYRMNHYSHYTQTE